MIEILVDDKKRKKKVFLVFVKLRWSGTYKILSKWSVVVKMLGNTDLRILIVPIMNLPKCVNRFSSKKYKKKNRSVDQFI